MGKKSTKKIGSAKKVEVSEEIKRKGYTIKFIKPESEKELNDLRGSEKIIDIVAISVATPDDKVDEFAIFVKD